MTKECGTEFFGLSGSRASNYGVALYVCGLTRGHSGPHTLKGDFTMRMRSVFYYVDFWDDSKRMLSIRAFTHKGKSGREWLDSCRENLRTPQEVREVLYKRYKGKLRNVGIEYDPEVVEAFPVARMELIDLT